MVTISSDYAILLRNCGLHPYTHSFLSIVQMAKPSDQLRFVERVDGDLHTAHKCHIGEESHEFFGTSIDGSRGRLAVVAGEGDAGLDWVKASKMVNLFDLTSTPFSNSSNRCLFAGDGFF